MEEMVFKRRDTFMDSLKFILMFLVVFGHVMQEHIDGNLLNATVYTFIYTFHMPLFILISGYFTNPNKSNKDYFVKIFNFFLVYLIFATIRGIIKDNLTLGFYLHPGGTLWYLVSLVWFRLFIWVFKKTKINVLVVIVLLVSFAGGFIQCDFLAFQRTVNFLPYFFIGYVIGQKKLLNTRFFVDGGAIPRVISIVTLVVIFLLCCKYNNKAVRECLYGWNYYNENYTIISRFVIYCLALLSMISVVHLIPDLKKHSRIGSDTLFIYMFHNYLTTPASRLLYKFNLPDNLLILFFIACFVFIVVSILSKIKLIHRLVEPASVFLPLFSFVKFKK